MPRHGTRGGEAKLEAAGTRGETNENDTARRNSAARRLTAKQRRQETTQRDPIDGETLNSPRSTGRREDELSKL